MEITGTIVNYYIHCKKQCYLFYNKINLENNSELVKIGKVIHEEKAKKNKNSEITIEHIKMDKISKTHIVEIKKSDADTDASIAQLKFYMYKLYQKGIIRNGRLEIIEKNKSDKKVIDIIFSDDIITEMISLEKEIILFLSQDPPKSYIEQKCKKCAYFEYCAL